MMHFSELLTLSFGLLCILDGAVAKKNKIGFTKWTSDNCGGLPSDEPRHSKKNECRKLDAQSVTFHVPSKDKWADWLHPIAARDQSCYAAVYENSACDERAGYTRTYVLPDDLEKCIAHPGGIRSLKFWCAPRQVVLTKTYMTTRQSADYTWNSAIRSPILTTITWKQNVTDVTVSNIVPYTTVAVAGLDDRSEPTGLERRDIAADQSKDHPLGTFWYKNPWGPDGAALCFYCKGKGENSKHFKCEMSNKKQYLCPPIPTQQFTIFEPAAPIITHPTVVQVVSSTPVPPVLQARREYAKVNMTHPVFARHVCAKVTWKHPGKDKAKMVIKGPISDCRNAQNIDVPPRTATVTVTLPPATLTLPVFKTDVQLQADMETVTLTSFI